MDINDTFEAAEDFYKVYDKHRTYVKTETRKKHLRDFTQNIWIPGDFKSTHRVLELGCGVGLFLSYLNAMGVRDFQGVEMDAKVRDFMPKEIADRIFFGAFEDYFLSDIAAETYFDRIVLLDVFEHFSPFEGVTLLRTLKKHLSRDGYVILRVPNCASPWGLQFQFNDLTHKAQYGPGNLGQVALAAGFECIGVFPYIRGSKLKRFTNDLVEALLSKALTDPPPIWSANFIGVYRVKQS